MNVRDGAERSADRLLEHSTAFVTGAARGIGLAIARRLVGAGAAVTLADLDADAAATAAEELRAEGAEAGSVGVDVTDEASLEAAAGTAAERLGEADIVIANAGVLHLAPLVDIELRDWTRVLDVNLTGTFLTCRTFARRLLAADLPGRIVVSSSLFGRRGGRENAAYSASKFGVVGLVESAAADLAPHGITVNAVCPGQVDTPMLAAVAEAKAATRGLTADAMLGDLRARVPMGRLADPAEVADAFLFLASPLAGYVTGQSLIVDGGWQVG